MTTPDPSALPAPTPLSQSMLGSIALFLTFFNSPIYGALQRPGTSNFAFGNPNEMPLPGYVSALHEHLDPRSPDWFAYKMSEPRSQAAVARSLSARTGFEWDPADVAMTNGGFAAIGSLADAARMLRREAGTIVEVGVTVGAVPRAAAPGAASG